MSSLISHAGRSVALDLLRGLSVIGMLLVITPGAWEHRYTWLDHVEWVGLVAADMVFPTFLFCVGVAIPLAFKKRIEQGAQVESLFFHVIWRSVALIAFGILLNAFPDFNWASVRIPGVLQRIGLCYGIVASLYLLLVSNKAFENELRATLWIFIVIAMIAISYWLFLALVSTPLAKAPVYDSMNSWPAVIDRAIFSVNHLWVWGTTTDANGVRQITYDPEGILSTFPACINVLIGTWVGQKMVTNLNQKNNIKFLIIAITLIISGLLWGAYFPIIKKIWTSSFAFFSSGVSLGLWALISFSVARLNIQKVFYPIEVFGANALLAFSISIVAGSLMDKSWLGNDLSFRYSTFHKLNSLITDPQIASLIYSLIAISCYFVILHLCYKQRWFLKF